MFAVDINECSDDLHNCHDNATCSDTDGSFQCFCNSGFDGDGVNCTSMFSFSQLARVANYYRCLLPATTVDIDECLRQLHNCSENALCTDIIGSFGCDCLAGYMGNGVNCTSKIFPLMLTIMYVH